VNVDGRLVHYRRAGDGPPIVMLHGSPGDSQMLETEMDRCAQDFTVLALDTPGFGHSDALSSAVLTVRDLARATAEALHALGQPPCPVYGTHTGAAIGIELGIGWPDQVTGLVLEGLPAFTEAEIATLFTHYFEPMHPDPLGGHLVSTWLRFRDQFTWFPWSSRSVDRLNAVDRPNPQAIDHWVSMFYRGCKTYQPAYRAACHYGPAALAAAADLALPTIYMASEEDMLFPHLDRLPPLRPRQRIERLAHQDDKIDAIARFLGELPQSGPLAARRRETPASPQSRMIVDGPHGQIFARLFGDPRHQPVMLLHDAPGSAIDLTQTAEAVSAQAFVIVPDHPGCGQTDAPAPSDDIIATAAENVIALADTLGIKTFIVGAQGCGAATAASLGIRARSRLRQIFLDDPPQAGERAATRIAPPLTLSPTGAHWVQAWLMLRDGQIYRPWYDGRIYAQRRRQGNFDAVSLHDRTVSLMEGRTTYHLYPQAAAAFDACLCLADAAIAFTTVAQDGLGNAIIATLNTEKG
jgi:pimeloyl-ACP methyl ester carboxylesterase